MKTSPQGVNFIKEFESLELTAYLCPAGVWTIGWGHTKGVKQGQQITLAQAEQLLQQDLLESEKCVNSKVLHINQNQFDALVSFVFNIGCTKFTTSTLLKRIKSGSSLSEIAIQFNRWVYDAKKRKLAGLVRRRKEEAEMYCR